MNQNKQNKIQQNMYPKNIQEYIWKKCQERDTELAELKRGIQEVKMHFRNLSDEGVKFDREFPIYFCNVKDCPYFIQSYDDGQYSNCLYSNSTGIEIYRCCRCKEKYACNKHCKELGFSEFPEWLWDVFEERETPICQSNDTPLCRDCKNFLVDYYNTSRRREKIKRKNLKNEAFS